MHLVRQDKILVEKWGKDQVSSQDLLGNDKINLETSASEADINIVQG